MKLWDLRRMVGPHQAQPPKKQYVWDYRGMCYPGVPGRCRHPADMSVATYLGHSVLRTLIRCKFSPPSWSGTCAGPLLSRRFVDGLISSPTLSARAMAMLQASDTRVLVLLTVKCTSMI